MPRKIQPKRGYRPQYLLGTAGEEDFASEIIDRLAHRYEIADERKADLAAFLRFALGIYRRTENNVDEAPHPKHIRAALEEIELTAAALASQLRELDHKSQRWLWGREAEVSDLASRENGPLRSSYGHSFWRHPTQDMGTIFWYLDEPKIEEAVAILVNYSRDALKRLPKDRGGRASDQALKIWVTNAANFWAETLKRKFTYNPHKPGGTPAFRFCCDALKASGLPFTRKSLGTHMTTLIAQRRGVDRQQSRIRKTPPR